MKTTQMNTNENLFDLDKTDASKFYFWLGADGVMVHEDGNDYSLGAPSDDGGPVAGASEGLV